MKTINPNHSSAVTFCVATTDDLVMQAKRLCHEVYLQVGYIDKPYADRIIPYAYESSSTYIVALNSAKEVVGTVRITQGPPFITFDVWKNKLYPGCASLIKKALHGNAFEIGALAVRKDYCTMKISWGLYKAVYMFSIALNLDYGVISMDCRALRSMEMVGWLVVKIGEPMDYFGSLTVPAIVPMKEQSQRITASTISYHQHLAA